jgi:hypothetical protein
MKTFILTIDESHEEVIKALAKALKFDLQQIDGDMAEEGALLKAMEEGKKYGRLSDEEGQSFIDTLGK